MYMLSVPASIEIGGTLSAAWHALLAVAAYGCTAYASRCRHLPRFSSSRGTNKHKQRHTLCTAACSTRHPRRARTPARLQPLRLAGADPACPLRPLGASGVPQPVLRYARWQLRTVAAFGRGCHRLNVRTEAPLLVLLVSRTQNPEGHTRHLRRSQSDQRVTIPGDEQSTTRRHGARSLVARSLHVAHVARCPSCPPRALL